MMRQGALPELRLACDSLVALGKATPDGAVLFAKNSDRPAHECQPLTQMAHRTYVPGTRLRCTYLDIPQAAETARLIGSRPFWGWGFEHGLNEYGVAVGNHTVFSRDALGNGGLTGMDLVRLGLERGRSAGETVEVITALLEQHGQGGSGYSDKEWPYHNSFLIADRATAFVLEASERHWAVRQVERAASVSNHLTIGADWDALSDGAIEHAIDAGWWNEQADERFDFAAAYRDTGTVPEAVSSGRHQRTRRLLEQADKGVSINVMKHALRDHYGLPAPATDLTPTDPCYFSVCMHAEPVGTTTASMIAHIPGDGRAPLIYWASLGSPCIGAFIPLFVDADIPEALSRGGAQASDGSPWWLMRQLLTLVEGNWAYAAHVRSHFDGFETAITERMRATQIWHQPRAEQAAFMQITVDAWLTELRRLIVGTQ